MRKQLFLFCTPLVCSLGDQYHRRTLDPRLERTLNDLNGTDEVKVFVGYRSAAGREQVEALTDSNQIPSYHDFHEVKAVAVRLPKAKLMKLARSSEIEYIEGNSRVFPLSALGADHVPYGIKLTQNDPRSGLDSFRRRNNPPKCSSSTVFRVAIVDSGVAVSHPDLACYPKNENARNCMGRTFGLSSTDDHWYDALLAIHGTHVAGTIGAVLNNQGIVGMIPDNNICYVFARVFGEDGSADFSDVLDAVRWAVSSDGGGAKIVNLSLGGAYYEKTSERVLQNLYDQGILIVGASGNDGGTEYNYPSAYSSVVSVAAVDQSMQRAYFSQANDRVDLAAPGVSVLSTIPISSSFPGVIKVNLQGSSHLATNMAFGANLPSLGITATISLCEAGGEDGCPDVSENICLIERGGTSFDDKALQCQLGGGVAAVIYNDESGAFEGALDAGTNVTIPALALSRDDGLSLLAQLGSNATLHEERGYGYLSGTSMAAPHVTGAIALIWRSCPACSNQEVQGCIYQTALDLGDSGKDDSFGFGLIQTSDAYDCLTGKDCCFSSNNTSNDITS